MASTMLLLVMVNIIMFRGADMSKVLLYPYGHCMNSHLLVMERLGAILGEKGYDVHMIVNSKYSDFRPSVEAEPLHNMTMVEFEAPHNFTTVCEYDSIDYSLYSPIPERFNFFIETSARYCEQLVSDSALMDVMRREQYDLFVVEAIDPCARVLADYLNVPFIPLLTTGLGHFDGNPRPPSYIPAPIAPFTPDMNFVERVGNLIMKVMYDNIPALMGFDQRFEDIKAKYGVNVSLSISDTFKRASVKLVNSDFTFEFAAPVEPDTVLVGGFAIREPAPLPRVIQNFIGGAGPEGVIVFSFGTVVKSFRRHWYDIFVHVFRQLPQYRVIWHAKHGGVPADADLPDNILLMDWIPQTDLLAHPDVRLFITHCGLNSAMEAVHFGKPIVGMPMFADQFSQSAKLTRHLGMGQQVDLFTLTTDSFHKAISEVLADPTYAYNARTMSRRFRDQLVSPADRILFWVEYVIRHKGAHHLKSHAAKLNMVQYLSLDVITCLFVALLACIYVLKAILRYVIYMVLARLTREKVKQT